MASFENVTISQANVTSQSTLQLDPLNIFILSFDFLFGPLIHGYIIYLILTRGRIVSDLIHFSLSVCEISISMTCLLYLLELRFPKLSAWSRFALGLMITGRPLFQSLMCVERYLAVVHPVTFLKYKPLRYKVMCCAASWIVTLGSCVFTLFTAVKHLKLYMLVVVLQFLFFFLVNLYCCLAVLSVLKQSGPGERKRGEENNMKAKAIQRILIITVTMFLFFTPTIIIGCLSVLTNLNVSKFISFGFFCFILGGFILPVLYLYQNGKLACSWKK